MVAQAVLVLFSPKGKIPKDKSWKTCRVVMGSIDEFLSELRNYDKENIHPEIVKAIQPYINDKGNLIVKSNTSADISASKMFKIYLLMYM